MTTRLAILVITASLLAGCAATPAVTPRAVPARVAAPRTSPDWVKPAQAVYTAALVAPDGVKGIFAFQVMATGHQDGIVYLNSELDYRDQRNLSVAISPQAAASLEKRCGLDPENYFLGRWIFVTGIAERTKIIFTVDGGRLTDKYYYQTHVNVTTATQIQEVK